MAVSKNQSLEFFTLSFICMRNAISRAFPGVQNSEKVQFRTYALFWWEIYLQGQQCLGHPGYNMIIPLEEGVPHIFTGLHLPDEGLGIYGGTPLTRGSMLL